MHGGEKKTACARWGGGKNTVAGRTKEGSCLGFRKKGGKELCLQKDQKEKNVKTQKREEVFFSEKEEEIPSKKKEKSSRLGKTD